MSQRQFIHLNEIAPRPAFLRSWEKHRHRKAHWFVECLAEFMGVFFYCYGGIGATAPYVLGNLADEPLGSLLTIGFGYAFGIVLALVICSSTSGGHFNPCVTIVMAMFRGFSWKKVPRYIVAQILGAYVASLLVYGQYKGLITQIETGLAAAGKLDAVQFTPQGPAGILALYVTPGSNLGYVLLNEFICDVFLALAIWGCLDPSNFMSPPAAAPWIIAFAYATVIWGYAPVGLAANSARDVGGRLAALTIYGMKASGGNYAALAALTNIIATIVGVIFYEFVFWDSARIMPSAQTEFMLGHKAHAHYSEHGHAPPAEDMHHHNLRRDRESGSSGDLEKGTVEHLE